jgi:methyl-accepting chemotaxis protein
LYLHAFLVVSINRIGIVAAVRIVKPRTRGDLALKEQSSASRDIAAQVETVARMVDKNAEAAASLSQNSTDMKTLADILHGNVSGFEVCG